MNTFAELKRKLQVGTRLQMTFRDFMRKDEAFPLQREIVKVMSTQIVMIDPTSPNAEELRKSGKGSYLAFPTAALMDISEKGFSLYHQGSREMTEQEKKVWDGRPIDEEQSIQDALTDGSVMFYREKRYYTEHGMMHLFGVGGTPEKLDHNNKDANGYPMIISSKVKGKLQLSYEFVG